MSEELTHIENLMFQSFKSAFNIFNKLKEEGIKFGKEEFSAISSTAHTLFIEKVKFGERNEPIRKGFATEKQKRFIEVMARQGIINEEININELTFQEASQIISENKTKVKRDY